MHFSLASVGLFDYLIWVRSGGDKFNRKGFNIMTTAERFTCTDALADEALGHITDEQVVYTIRDTVADYLGNIMEDVALELTEFAFEQLTVDFTNGREEDLLRDAIRDRVDEILDSIDVEINPT